MFISMLHLVIIILSLDCRKDVAPSHRICAVESIHGFCGNHFHSMVSANMDLQRLVFQIVVQVKHLVHLAVSKFHTEFPIISMEYISVTCGVLPCKTNHPRIVYWVYLGAMGCKNHPQVIPPAMTLPTTRSSAVGNATTAHPPDPVPPRDPAAARSEKDASGSRSGGRHGISRWTHMFGHVPNGKCTQRNRMQTG